MSAVRGSSGSPADKRLPCGRYDGPDARIKKISITNNPRALPRAWVVSPSARPAADQLAAVTAPRSTRAARLSRRMGPR
jgi:hypothetical protein